MFFLRSWGKCLYSALADGDASGNDMDLLTVYQSILTLLLSKFYIVMSVHIVSIAHPYSRINHIGQH